MKCDRWISVKDRLPDMSKSVLVSQYENEVNNGMYVAWIEKLGMENKPMWQYSWCCGCFVPAEVTHWMDLPSCPKEKEISE